MVSAFRKARSVRQLIAVDAAVALGLALLPALSPLRRPGGDGALGWVMWAAAAAPLVVRRIRPWPVFLAVLAVAVASVPLGLAPTAFLAAAFAAYPVALLTGPPPFGRSAAVIGGTSAAGVALLAVGGSPHYSGGTQAVQVVFGVLLLGATWAAGLAVRERREGVRRAVELAGERARREERLRIAREIHDVVTHSVGLIAVKAGIANHVAATRPEEAGPALTAIEEISRKALSDLRATLVVLRGEDGSGGGDLRPARGLADLPELVRAAELAGVRAELTTHWAVEPPGGVALAAYRIVQEALTNTAKHAGPTRCRVHVVAVDGELTVEVADEGPSGGGPGGPGEPGGPGGPGGPVPGGRLGLLGMRERAHAHGGTLAAGPGDSGWTVRAVLPY
ncbi:sensor histidine kinase [Kitasatospora sp. NPDC092948]|uniref:sensor histidine kinase n=1 Tax=Kitasatospora sp. NPDC092948 TaxID=3364088 RepID=UPI0037F1AD87